MGTPDNSEHSAGEDNTKFKDGVNRNARLIVRNISFKATEEALKDHFSQYGTVEEVKLLRKPDGKLVGCGFVHYTHVPMANEALTATNKKPFLDRPISVAWAIPKHKYGEHTDPSETKKLLHGISNGGSKPQIKKEKEEQSKVEKNQTRVNRNARLIIRNVSFKATDESLRQHFEPYGNVLDVNLLKKPDGKLVGCAFVTFKNVPMAKKALLNTNMKPFLGRPVSVDWAVAKNKYMQHVVTQQLELQDDVKKEELDSEDDDNEMPLNVSSDDLKIEMKSESEEETKSGDESDDSAADSDKDDDKNEEDSEDEDDEDDEEDELDDDDESQTSAQPDRQRIKLNDAEDGFTVFITNIPFSVDNDLLREFAERTGPVKYALVCLDKLTEHSKGSGFVKFVNQPDAEKFLALPPEALRLEGQALTVKPALKRESLQKSDKKESKDNRNLYLVKEGVVVAGTKAAEGLSSSDMAKRLALERSKTQMLKNLNRFVSRYRLVVSNLPPSCDDARLRRVCTAGGARAVVTECRVMRDLRAQPGADGKQPSKGYGFVMFPRHEDALACLRRLNNNPDIFDSKNRPIVSFSIEDRTALNARKKRLEKSIANNPLANRDETTDKAGNKNRKRKATERPDESYIKMRRMDKNKKQNRQERDKNRNQNRHEPGRFVKRPNDERVGDFTGITAKEGAQHKMRSNHKLKAQADIHRQQLKMEKKKSKRTMRLKMAAKERIKQPKQKQNTNKTGRKSRKKNNKFYGHD